jgi:glyoxylase-like metal-dependent hydrolase (beta-lactamase superfamily II)
MAVERVSQLGFVNAYLTEEPEGLTIIDTLLPRQAKRIVKAAGRRAVARILLTHAHGDHVGSADALYEALPNAELIISARDARLLEKDMTLEPGEPDDKLRGSYPGIRTKPDRLIGPGDRVGSLEALAAPGHTPGQLAFLDPRDGTLYCADAFSTLGGVETTARTNPRFPLPALATWHRPTALETARRLRDLSPRRLAPGHGKVVEKPGEAMDRAIARAASA